ncbi:MAG: TatD family hydrolase [Proteobacteria bacterium]|nr:TatD family hydrolase [Pseudomonadota bacterium]
MELIDIGSNLTHESFVGDFDAVLQRAGAAGVVQQIVTGTSVEASAAALALHARYPQQLFATVGVHPHHAEQLTTEALASLQALALQLGAVAIGECGLDYFRNFAPRQAQCHAFAAQLAVAAQHRLPVFLHQRDAHSDFMAVLREHRGSLVGGIAHCFTGQRAELDDCLAMGLYIGITGWICDERRGLHLQELVRHIPADRLMIETDAPYLLPRSLRPKPAGRRNEPAFLPEVARVIAHARSEDVVELAAVTTANARRFFGLPAAA